MYSFFDTVREIRYFHTTSNHATNMGLKCGLQIIKQDIKSLLGKPPAYNGPIRHIIFNSLGVTEGQLQLIKVWVFPLGKPIRLSLRYKMQICKAWKCFLAEQLRRHAWLNTEYISSNMWDCVAQWQETFLVQTYVQTNAVCVGVSTSRF